MLFAHFYEEFSSKCIRNFIKNTVGLQMCLVSENFKRPEETVTVLQSSDGRCPRVHMNILQTQQHRKSFRQPAARMIVQQGECSLWNAFVWWGGTSHGPVVVIRFSETWGSVPFRGTTCWNVNILTKCLSYMVQGMLATTQFRIFCLPVCHLKT
jgi:hypothetical protein